MGIITLWLGFIGIWATVYWLIKIGYRAFGYFFPHKVGGNYFQDTLAAWHCFLRGLKRLEDATSVRWSADDFAEADMEIRHVDHSKDFLHCIYAGLLQRAILREEKLREHNASFD